VKKGGDLLVGKGKKRKDFIDIDWSKNSTSINDDGEGGSGGGDGNNEERKLD
jgi:hypothetical protein